jgi:hypothetical protein
MLWSFGTLCVHLVHCVFIWYIVCSFGTLCVHLVHFSDFGIMFHEKSGNPDYIHATGHNCNSCCYIVRHCSDFVLNNV